MARSKKFGDSFGECFAVITVGPALGILAAMAFWVYHHGW